MLLSKCTLLSLTSSTKYLVILKLSEFHIISDHSAFLVLRLNINKKYIKKERERERERTRVGKGTCDKRTRPFICMRMQQINNCMQRMSLLLVTRRLRNVALKAHCGRRTRRMLSTAQLINGKTLSQ